MRIPLCLRRAVGRRQRTGMTRPLVVKPLSPRMVQRREKLSATKEQGAAAHHQSRWLLRRMSLNSECGFAPRCCLFTHGAKCHRLYVWIVSGAARVWSRMEEQEQVYAMRRIDDDCCVCVCIGIESRWVGMIRLLGRPQDQFAPDGRQDVQSTRAPCIRGSNLPPRATFS